MEYNYQDYHNIAGHIKRHIGDFEPEIGIILGLDQADFSKKIKEPTTILYEDIPGFSYMTGLNHNNKIICGLIGNKKVVCMCGRIHYYEGYNNEQLALPVRILKLLGIKKLLLTNISGAINTDYHVGDVMIIKDHINLTGLNVLIDQNINEFGPRFPDMNQVYNEEMICIAKQQAINTPITIREGVYFFFAGPQFETPAEIKAARILGGDVAGMSTVNEVQTAAHCHLPVLGISFISNMASGVMKTSFTLNEVNDAISHFETAFENYLFNIIQNL